MFQVSGHSGLRRNTWSQKKKTKQKQKTKFFFFPRLTWPCLCMCVILSWDTHMGQFLLVSTLEDRKWRDGQEDRPPLPFSFTPESRVAEGWVPYLKPFCHASCKCLLCGPSLSVHTLWSPRPQKNCCPSVPCHEPQVCSFYLLLVDVLCVMFHLRNTVPE